MLLTRSFISFYIQMTISSPLRFLILTRIPLSATCFNESPTKAGHAMYDLHGPFQLRGIRSARLRQSHRRYVRRTAFDSGVVNALDDVVIRRRTLHCVVVIIRLRARGIHELIRRRSAWRPVHVISHYRIASACWCLPCQTHDVLNSHTAAGQVKRLCREAGKEFLPLRTASLASFLAAARMHKDAAATQPLS